MEQTNECCYICDTTLTKHSREILNFSDAGTVALFNAAVKICLPKITPLDCNKLCKSCFYYISCFNNYRTEWETNEVKIRRARKFGLPLNLENIMKSIINYDIFKICRLCIKKTPIDSVNPVFVEQQKETIIHKLLSLHCPLTDLNSTIDPVICHVCLTKIQMFDNFYKMCLQNQLKKEKLKSIIKSGEPSIRKHCEATTAGNYVEEFDAVENMGKYLNQLCDIDIDEEASFSLNQLMNEEVSSTIDVKDEPILENEAFTECTSIDEYGKYEKLDKPLNTASVKESTATNSSSQGLGLPVFQCRKRKRDCQVNECYHPDYSKNVKKKTIAKVDSVQSEKDKIELKNEKCAENDVFKHPVIAIPPNLFQQTNPESDLCTNLNKSSQSRTITIKKPPKQIYTVAPAEKKQSVEERNDQPQTGQLMTEVEVDDIDRTQLNFRSNFPSSKDKFLQVHSLSTINSTNLINSEKEAVDTNESEMPNLLHFDEDYSERDVKPELERIDSVPDSGNISSPHINDQNKNLHDESTSTNAITNNDATKIVEEHSYAKIFKLNNDKKYKFKMNNNRALNDNNYIVEYDKFIVEYENSKKLKSGKTKKKPKTTARKKNKGKPNRKIPILNVNADENEDVIMESNELLLRSQNNSAIKKREKSNISPVEGMETNKKIICDSGKDTNTLLDGEELNSIKLNEHYPEKNLGKTQKDTSQSRGEEINVVYSDDKDTRSFENEESNIRLVTQNTDHLQNEFEYCINSTESSESLRLRLEKHLLMTLGEDEAFSINKKEEMIHNSSIESVDTNLEKLDDISTIPKESEGNNSFGEDKTVNEMITLPLDSSVKADFDTKLRPIRKSLRMQNKKCLIDHETTLPNSINYSDNSGVKSSPKRKKQTKTNKKKTLNSETSNRKILKGEPSTEEKSIETCSSNDKKNVSVLKKCRVTLHNVLINKKTALKDNSNVHKKDINVKENISDHGPSPIQEAVSDLIRNYKRGNANTSFQDEEFMNQVENLRRLSDEIASKKRNKQVVPGMLILQLNTALGDLKKNADKNAEWTRLYELFRNTLHSIEIKHKTAICANTSTTSLQMCANEDSRKSKTELEHDSVPKKSSSNVKILQNQVIAEKGNGQKDLSNSEDNEDSISLDEVPPKKKTPVSKRKSDGLVKKKGTILSFVEANFGVKS